MVEPYFTQSEFLSYLQEQGVEIVGSQVWEDGFIRITKGGESFPLQLRKVYWFHIVVDLCKDFGIDPPEHMKKRVEDWKKIPRSHDK